ncbi:MAG: hypothetical protein HY735_04735 [Verrucomicrobia bacterium]|nr:hypothetical protein [Verrucomicrobiota bacterium]
MRTDSITKYVALRRALLNEKAKLEAGLARINQALSVDSPRSVPAVSKHKPARAPRLKNRMSLRAAVIQVTKAKPLTKPEILGAVQKLGYRFASAQPMRSLNTILYTNRQFKNSGGKFSPA